ncbi:GNAT family N-acetyltransferase [Mucilaginibacter sp. ZT4R22]|uniref:GNAT family N-acetyltransferase n=1 Tax=Mucilaginibacter pankratovii TaxID=2772110 RepID=A0ABR7WKX6_9SPHI|nr:GNAT family N-acetyltransferase [Mucilaginibacter pankratovii]MBD1362984.1 GNAT family N-acetyltransferase [Mucilaginibacter pankratovii]
MSIQKYTVDFQPNLAQQEQVKSWMVSENLENTGLYHYPDNITYHADKCTLAIITRDHEAIGFVTWDIFKRSGHIAVAAIAATYRKSGAGRFMVEAVLNYLKLQGLAAIHLECAPANSENFWRKMGFQPMPEIPAYTGKGSPALFKILSTAQEIGVTPGEAVQIYKWGSDEKTLWPVSYRTGTNQLINPIITPAYKDWCIEHIKFGIALRSDKIKNFRSGTCYDDPFLIITEL